MALLFGRRKALCPLRAVARLEAEGAIVPLAGSKMSAEARSADPLLPPITATLPSSVVVAVADMRGVERLGPPPTVRVTGSKMSTEASGLAPSAVPPINNTRPSLSTVAA